MMYSNLPMTGPWGRSILAAFLATGMSSIAFADIDNTASFTATPPSGANITGSATETIFLEAAAPEMEVTKSLSSLTTANGDSATATDGDDTITYSIFVENTGNVTLTGVTVNDPGPTFGPTNVAGTNTVGTPTLVAATDTDGDGELDVDETWEYTYTYVLSQDDVNAGAGDNIYNTVDVAATDPGGNTVDEAPTSDLDETVPLPLVATADFTKIATRDGAAEDDGSVTPYAVGETVTYVFTVTNTGNVTLTGVTVSEDAFGGSNGPVTITPASADIDPGEDAVFTGTYVITQDDIDNN